MTIMQLAFWAEELRAMAQNGLLYANNDFDRDRYTRLRAIAAELSALVSSGEPLAIAQEFERLPGYATPKVGVAAAIFNEQAQIFLIQRADNQRWAMPGGWADVALTPAQNTAKEVREETGLEIEVQRLLGVYDGRSNAFRNVYHLYHLVFLCQISGGTLQLHPDEALAAEFFAQDALPELSPGHAPAIADAFARRSGGDAYFDPLLRGS